MQMAYRQRETSRILESIFTIHSLAIAMTLAFLIIFMISQKAMAESNETGIIIPLYSYPGPTWDTLIQEKKLHPTVPVIAIINPDNGPGIKNSDYLDGIQRLQSSGITVLGYVYTGNTDLSTVTTYINEYKNWYHVNGIFFDQMYNDIGHELYYRHLSEYVKLLGMNMTVGNPGVDTLPSYIGTVDNLVVHDDPGLPSSNLFGGWHSDYTKSNFSIISYDIHNVNETFVADSTKYVKFLYLTDASGSNPFDSLPTYLDGLFSDLAKYGNHVSTITVTSNSIEDTPIEGLWTIVNSRNGSSSGFTPFSFLASKDSYTVTISDFKNYHFDHWDDNSTNSTRTIFPLQNMTLEAYFRTNNQTASDIKNQSEKSQSQSETKSPIIVEKNGRLALNIYYMSGEKAGYYSTSLKVYQDFSSNPFEEIESISENPYTISLPLDHNYKIEVYVNGQFAAVNYAYLSESQQSLDFKIPFPGGMRITVLYNDGLTPIPGATVSIASKDNTTWATGITDENGQMLRQWIEPTIVRDDYYIATITIGHLSYTESPIYLQPGYAQEFKIKSPWPPIIDSLITVKLYDGQSKIISKSDGNYVVNLYDSNQKKVMSSSINFRGDAYFYNLRVGDYTLVAMDQDNGVKLAQKNVTLDGNRLSFTLRS